MTTGITRAKYAQASLATYQSGDGVPPSGWTQLVHQSATSIGFSATAYQTSTGEIVIAYAGTQSPGSGFTADAVNDIQMLLDVTPDQYIEALDFYNTVKNAHTGITITATGQSLGGSLAQLVAAKTGISATTYNSLGIAGLVDDCGITTPNTSNITNYSLGNDLANVVNIALGLNQLGTTFIIPSTGDFPVDAHNDFKSLKSSAVIPQDSWISQNKFMCDLIEKLGANLSSLVGIDAWNDFCDMFGLDGLDDVQDLFNQAEAAEPIRVDPIVFDLDGDGIIETTTVQNGVYFDHSDWIVDGFAEATAWVGSDDGILVVDSNNNGIIDNGTEVIKDLSMYEFNILSRYDSNHDNVIDSNDAGFSELKILKGDGGIASINLNKTDTNIIDSNGNRQLWTGTYTKTDETTAIFGDYGFSTKPVYSIAKEWVEVPAYLADLPDIPGYGTVYSLHQALARENYKLKKVA